MEPPAKLSKRGCTGLAPVRAVARGPAANNPVEAHIGPSPSAKDAVLPKEITS